MLIYCSPLFKERLCEADKSYDDPLRTTTPSARRALVSDKTILSVFVPSC
jgi:hypothetical protein